MTDEQFREACESATRLVATWPAWKQNILVNSSKAFVDVPRTPIIHGEVMRKKPFGGKIDGWCYVHHRIGMGYHIVAHLFDGTLMRYDDDVDYEIDNYMNLRDPRNGSNICLEVRAKPHMDMLLAFPNPEPVPETQCIKDAPLSESDAMLAAYPGDRPALTIGDVRRLYQDRRFAELGRRLGIAPEARFRIPDSAPAGSRISEWTNEALTLHIRASQNARPFYNELERRLQEACVNKDGPALCDILGLPQTEGGSKEVKDALVKWLGRIGRDGWDRMRAGLGSYDELMRWNAAIGLGIIPDPSFFNIEVSNAAPAYQTIINTKQRLRAAEDEIAVLNAKLEHTLRVNAKLSFIDPSGKQVDVPLATVDLSPTKISECMTIIDRSPRTSSDHKQARLHIMTSLHALVQRMSLALEYVHSGPGRRNICLALKILGQPGVDSLINKADFDIEFVRQQLKNAFDSHDASMIAGILDYLDDHPINSVPAEYGDATPVTVYLQETEGDIVLVRGLGQAIAEHYGEGDRRWWQDSNTVAFEPLVGEDIKYKNGVYIPNWCIKLLCREDTSIEDLRRVARELGDRTDAVYTPGEKLEAVAQDLRDGADTKGLQPLLAAIYDLIPQPNDVKHDILRVLSVASVAASSDERQTVQSQIKLATQMIAGYSIPESDQGHLMLVEDIIFKAVANPSFTSNEDLKRALNIVRAMRANPSDPTTVKSLRDRISANIDYLKAQGKHHAHLDQIDMDVEVLMGRSLNLVPELTMIRASLASLLGAEGVRSTITQACRLIDEKITAGLEVPQPEVGTGMTVVRPDGNELSALDRIAQVLKMPDARFKSFRCHLAMCIEARMKAIKDRAKDEDVDLLINALNNIHGGNVERAMDCIRVVKDRLLDVRRHTAAAVFRVEQTHEAIMSRIKKFGLAETNDVFVAIGHIDAEICRLRKPEERQPAEKWHTPDKRDLRQMMNICRGLMFQTEATRPEAELLDALSRICGRFLKRQNKVVCNISVDTSDLEAAIKMVQSKLLHATELVPGRNLIVWLRPEITERPNEQRFRILDADYTTKRIKVVGMGDIKKVPQWFPYNAISRVEISDTVTIGVTTSGKIWYHS